MNCNLRKSFTTILLAFALVIPGGNLLAEDLPEGTWHGERSGVEFFPYGKNLAYHKPAATVNPRLTEH